MQLLTGLCGRHCNIQNTGLGLWTLCLCTPKHQQALIITTLTDSVKKIHIIFISSSSKLWKETKRKEQAIWMTISLDDKTNGKIWLSTVTEISKNFSSKEGNCILIAMQLGNNTRSLKNKQTNKTNPCSCCVTTTEPKRDTQGMKCLPLFTGAVMSDHSMGSLIPWHLKPTHQSYFRALMHVLLPSSSSLLHKL